MILKGPNMERFLSKWLKCYCYCSALYCRPLLLVNETRAICSANQQSWKATSYVLKCLKYSLVTFNFRY